MIESRIIANFLDFMTSEVSFLLVHSTLTHDQAIMNHKNNSVLEFYLQYAISSTYAASYSACSSSTAHHRFLGGLLIEELHHQRDHFAEIFGLAAFVLVLVRLEPAFDVNETSLLEILLGNLAQPSPSFDVHPFGIFFGLVSALPALR